MAEAHGESEAEELLLVAAGGGGEHGSGTGHEDVRDEAESGGTLGEGHDSVLALITADVAAAFSRHIQIFL